MKIKITETQLKRTLKEVGGYDSGDLMGMHGGSLHGELRGRTTQLILLTQQMINALVDEELSKEQVMAGVHQLTGEIEGYNERVKELIKEIYIDDDFKSIMVEFLSALNKISKYFKLLVNTDGGVYGGQPFNALTGLSMDMRNEELKLEIAKKLSYLGDHISKLGEMFNDIAQRYGQRLDGQNN